MAGVPEATYRAALAALVAFDRRADLPRINVPTLVLTGEHDRAAPPAVAQRLAQKIPRAALSILPGAGHLAPIEQPKAFARALQVFLTTMT
jgi:pimeloyl-ACP methyl ester carboxylesterase